MAPKRDRARPKLLVITKNRVRARLGLGRFFADWDLVCATGPEWIDPEAQPALVIIDGDSFARDTLAEELVPAARRAYPTSRAVLLTASYAPAIVNRAQLCCVELVVSVDAEDNFRRLADSPGWYGDDIERRVVRLACDYQLSARETEVVELALRGRARPEIARQLGISINSVKTLTRRVLRKARVSRLTDLPDTRTPRAAVIPEG